MTKFLVVPVACALLAVSGLAASANHSHRVHHTTKDTHDPNFNPAEFPLCFAWDFKLRRDVWICGRWAY
ncbi:MAG: hypothetical protein J0H94_19900 [Rhizobiales bacterium]|jgi:hypothetical protein|nr:hypothetical protein [Hyphomicrobiales bacterium]